MRRRLAQVFMAASLLVALAPAPASALDTWLRPVAGRVVRSFRAPLTRFGKGHAGVDFAAAPGTPVRAAGPGTVAFAGLVAGARYVVVRHAGGLRTTYAFLASIRVRKGQVLRRGAVVGTTGGRGENHEPDALHLGLRIAGAYVDPMQLFAPGAAPTDLTVRVHLAPVDGPLSSAADPTGSGGPRAPIVLPPPDPGPGPERVVVPVGRHRLAS